MAAPSMYIIIILYVLCEHFQTKYLTDMYRNIKDGHWHIDINIYLMT